MKDVATSATTDTTVVVEFDVTRGWLRAPDHHVVEIVLDRFDGRIEDVRHFVARRGERRAASGARSVRTENGRRG